MASCPHESPACVKGKEVTLLFALILSVTFCIPSEREREREGGMEGARERESRLEGKPWRQTLYMHASRHPAPAADFLIGLFPHVWSSSPTCCPPPPPLVAARQNLQPDLSNVASCSCEQNKTFSSCVRHLESNLSSSLSLSRLSTDRPKGGVPPPGSA